MTTFRTGGNKTAFNKSGVNQTMPNEFGPPATKFTGRGAVPGGPFKRYPGGTANISGTNRKVARSNAGDDGGMGTNFSTHTAFSGGRKGVKSGGSPAAHAGRSAMKLNKK